MKILKNPNIRFIDDNADWEEKKLSDILCERNISSIKNSGLEHVSLTKDGVISKGERYERDFLVTTENKKYKITKLNDICYNPANLKFGVICRNKYKNGIFSPIYITFEINKDYLPNFVELLVTNPDFIKTALMFQEGTVYERMAVSPTNLLSIHVHLPTLKTQQKISSLLSNIDQKINAEETLIQKLKDAKSAMLLKMFPQENQSVPELRFVGFNNAWEQCKLEDVVDVRSGKDYKHLSEGNIPVYGTGGYMLSVNQALSYNEDAIGIGRKGTINKPYILKAPFWTVDTLFYAVPSQNSDLDFVFDIFQNIDWKKKDESTGVPSLSKTAINEIDISAPCLEEQQVIGSYFSKLDHLITLHQCECI